MTTVILAAHARRGLIIWFNFFYDGDFEQCVYVLGNGLIHLVIMFTGNQLLIQLSLV